MNVLSTLLLWTGLIATGDTSIGAKKRQVTDRSRTVAGFCISTTWRRFASQGGTMQFIPWSMAVPLARSLSARAARLLQDVMWCEKSQRGALLR